MCDWYMNKSRKHICHLCIKKPETKKCKPFSVQKEWKPTLKKREPASACLWLVATNITSVVTKKDRGLLWENGISEFLHELLTHNITTVVTNKDQGHIRQHSHKIQLQITPDAGRRGREAQQAAPPVSLSLHVRVWGVAAWKCYNAHYIWHYKQNERANSEQCSSTFFSMICYNPHYNGHYKQKKASKNTTLQFYNTALQKM